MSGATEPPAVLHYEGREVELPVVRGSENELGVDIAKLRAQTGLITLDYGFMNSGSCESAVTYIDGDEGILRYRGIPIEQLVEGHAPSFIETSYLLIYGNLPTTAQLDEFRFGVRKHTLLHEDANYEGALAAFEEAAAAERDAGRPFEDLHWYLGDTLAKLDRYAEAETQFREELRAFPRSIPTYASLAMLYRASNRERGVDDVIAELLDAAPTAEAYATAARLWTILGERDRAAAIRSEARGRFRGDPSLALFERAR